MIVAAVGQFSFFTTEELRAAGHTVGGIRAAIERGELERVQRGWYCTRATDRDAVRAMRLGGRASCISALKLHGAWQPPDAGLHIGFPSHASGRRAAVRGLPPQAVTHWHAKEARTGSRHAVAPLELAVGDLLACQPPFYSIAVLDSLLHRRIVRRNRLEAMILRGPHRMRSLVDHLEPRSEEGIESIVRFRLAAAGIRAKVQVVVRTSTRVDLLIDDWLVLEIDGRDTHDTETAFTHDRVRSAWIIREGRIVVRFAYATVIYDWPFVFDTVHAIMRQHAPVA
jgi:very-short-patch-repair endonuclease